jgi:hypothetical protein
VGDLGSLTEPVRYAGTASVDAVDGEGRIRRANGKKGNSASASKDKATSDAAASPATARRGFIIA